MKRIFLAILALIVAAVAAVFIYFNFIREDAPEAFGLTETSAEGEDGAESDTGGEDTGTEDTGAEDSTDQAADGSGDGDAAPADDQAVTLDGTWTVAAGSEAGYRVVEDLGAIQDFEAVGRTSDISGSIDISGTTISGGSFEVDVASISSDDEKRDGQFTGPIMDATQFPTATLALTGPIELDAIPGAGSVVETTAAGELTLRDTTNAVNFPVQAQLLGGQIEIVASVDVLFSDYGIANPSNPFVSVRDEGKVEVKLLLDKG